MLFEYVPLYAALVGSSIAAYIDLRTTEIPDEIPAAMAVFGLFWGLLNFVSTGSTALVQGLIVGGALFGLGFIMYYTGQWGGGDAKLLAAMGLLVPGAPVGFTTLTFFPFALSVLLNVFILGAVYIVFYSMMVSIPNARVMKAFTHDVRGGWKEIGLFSGVLVVVVLATLKLVGGVLSQQQVLLTLSLLPGGLGLFLMWRFLKVVEKVGFQKKISTKELREGDMLGEDVPELKLYKKLIRGLEKHEVKKLQKTRKDIWIREGVRFGPVFPIALVYTLYFGDAMLLFSLVA